MIRTYSKTQVYKITEAVPVHPQIIARISDEEPGGHTHAILSTTRWGKTEYRLEKISDLKKGPGGVGISNIYNVEFVGRLA